MKNIRKHVVSGMVVFFVLIVAFSVHVVFFRLPAIPKPEDSRAQWGLPIIGIVTPNKIRIAAEIARSSSEHEKGLMYRSVVPPQTGMLFVYNENKYQTIWMKNTLVDLDLLYLNDRKKVVCIYKNVKHPELGKSDTEKRVGYGRYILELPAGESTRLGLNKGDTLRFRLPGQ